MRRILHGLFFLVLFLRLQSLGTKNVQTFYQGGIICPTAQEIKNNAESLYSSPSPHVQDTAVCSLPHGLPESMDMATKTLPKKGTLHPYVTQASNNLVDEQRNPVLVLSCTSMENMQKRTYAYIPNTWLNR